MEERRYVVIADDLTGSNDTGIQFLEAGYRSLVILDPAELSSLEDHGATVVDTESRNAAAAEAARVMGAVADYLEPMRGRRIVYKKVDSTLRGNIAVEVAVLEHRLGLPVTVFAPAYPRNGRTVRDGLLLLDGVPVAETEMGRDPRKPVVTSSLQKTLRGEEGWETVRHVARDAIRNGYIPREGNILLRRGDGGGPSLHRGRRDGGSRAGGCALGRVCRAGCGPGDAETGAARRGQPQSEKRRSSSVRLGARHRAPRSCGRGDPSRMPRRRGAAGIRCGDGHTSERAKRPSVLVLRRGAEPSAAIGRRGSGDKPRPRRHRGSGAPERRDGRALRHGRRGRRGGGSCPWRAGGAPCPGG